MSTYDINNRWPTLGRWMRNAVTDHPMHVIQNTNDLNLIKTLDSFNEIITIVEAANPARVGSKIREFQQATTEVRILEVRTELAVAAKLARSNIEFDFSGTTQSNPDLLIRGIELGVEVTSTTPPGFPHLYDELEQALGAVENFSVHLTFSDLPVRMQEPERRELTEQIIRHIEDTRTGGALFYAFNDTSNQELIEVTAQILPVPGLGRTGGRVTFDIADEHKGLVQARLIGRIVEIPQKPQKARQGAAMRSVIIIDIARLGGAFAMDLSDLAQQVQTVLPDDLSFKSIALVNANIHESDISITWILTPSANEDDRTVIDGFFRSIDDGR